MPVVGLFRPFVWRAVVGAFPGRECLFRPDHICVLAGLLYSRLSGDVFHVLDVICSRLKCQLSGDAPSCMIVCDVTVIVYCTRLKCQLSGDAFSRTHGVY